jgi:hypothetical protein
MDGVISPDIFMYDKSEGVLYNMYCVCPESFEIHVNISQIKQDSELSQLNDFEEVYTTYFW